MRGPTRKELQRQLDEERQRMNALLRYLGLHCYRLPSGKAFRVSPTDPATMLTNETPWAKAVHKVNADDTAGQLRSLQADVEHLMTLADEEAHADAV